MAPGGGEGGAVSLESPCLWIPPSFISYQSTSSSSFRAKLQAYFFPFSLESFITVLRIYYVASLSCDLGFGGFPPFGTNALIWVWFAGKDGSGIIIFKYLDLFLLVFFGVFFFESCKGASQPFGHRCLSINN